MSAHAHVLLKPTSLFLIIAGVFGVACVSHAEQLQTERVRGFFCNAKSDSIAFLTHQAQGENEEIAANSVNKSLAQFSCAYYLPADAIYTGDHTVIERGVVYKLQSYMFLPEKVERWTGSAIGSLQQSARQEHDA
jgi:hypothetical protein